MLNPISSCTIYFLEMLIIYIFFTKIARQRLCSISNIICGTILWEIGSLVNLLSSNNVPLNTIYSFFCIFAFSLTCFKIKPFHALSYSITLIVINFSLEILTILCFSSILGTDISKYNDNTSLFFMMVLINKSLLFLTCLIISTLLKGAQQSIKVPFQLLFYPLSNTICLSILWYICVQLSQILTLEQQIFFVITSLILFFSTIILFVIYQHQLEDEKETLLIKQENERLQTEKAYYDILEKQNRKLMLYVHDTKNHLAAIQSASSNQAVHSYIDKLSSELSKYSSTCHSGNKMLDIIIYKYASSCESQEITFSYDVKTCNLHSMSDLDLVAILGNLLDNAITAAEQSKEKFISFSTTFRDHYDVIIIENSSDIAPRFEGRHLFTTKSDKDLHGFGLASVTQTLKKYNGDYDWEYDEKSHRFLITVMIKSE